MAIAFDRAFARFLSVCPYIQAVYDLSTKWRIELNRGYILDLYFNESLGKYSYTLVQGDQRIIGWDNAPHHPSLENFPHHQHISDGTVEPSTMNGDPEHDLEIVCKEIEKIIET